MERGQRDVLHGWLGEVNHYTICLKFDQVIGVYPCTLHVALQPSGFIRVSDSAPASSCVHGCGLDRTVTMLTLGIGADFEFRQSFRMFLKRETGAVGGAGGEVGVQAAW